MGRYNAAAQIKLSDIQTTCIFHFVKENEKIGRKIGGKLKCCAWNRLWQESRIVQYAKC